MKEKILGIKDNPELRGTMIVTVGALLGSFFSYLLQFFMGRMLSVEDYGTFNALLSLSYLVWVPSGVLATSLIKTVSELLAKNDFRRLTRLFWRVVFSAFAFGFVLSLIITVCRYALSSYLNISEPEVIIYFAIFVGFSYLSIAPTAYLQGLLRYRSYAFLVVVNSFFRWLIPSALVYFNYRLFGVFGGISMAAVIAFTAGTLLLKRNFTEGEDLDIKKQVKRLLYFGFPVMFVNFGMMLLNNMDMLLVKRFFSPEMAGYYAGTVTLGKILLFGAGTVTIVMFPRISNLHTQGVDYTRQLEFLYFLQLLMVVSGVTLFSIFPKLLTTAFFGQRFLNSVEYLPRFVIFIGIYALINFMVMYFLAIDKTKVSLFLLPIVLVQYVLISLFHADLFQVININILVSVILYIGLLVYFWKSKFQVAENR